MKNSFFTHFLSDLPGPLSFYTALENNPIFLQQFFHFLRGGKLPPLRRAGTPGKIKEMSDLIEIG